MRTGRINRTNSLPGVNSSGSISVRIDERPTLCDAGPISIREVSVSTKFLSALLSCAVLTGSPRAQSRPADQTLVHDRISDDVVEVMVTENSGSDRLFVTLHGARWSGGTSRPSTVASLASLNIHAWVLRRDGTVLKRTTEFDTPSVLSFENGKYFCETQTLRFERTHVAANELAGVVVEAGGELWSHVLPSH
jgi:hypothetical protein